MKRIKNLKASDGFTIIELLIATAVLSTILLMVTVVMINIGHLYYKGINQSRIQDNVRAITDDVSQHLKLGDNFFQVNNGSTYAYCIGDTRYTYLLYKQIGTNPGPPDYQSQHVLWRDTNPTPGSCPSVLLDLSTTLPSANGTELAAPNSRLTSFSIIGSSPYNIVVGEAYGDNDLLCDTGTLNDCTTSYNANSVIAKLITGLLSSPTGNIYCRGSIGDQFCATSNLNTTVVSRLP